VVIEIKFPAQATHYRYFQKNQPQAAGEEKSGKLALGFLAQRKVCTGAG
jgi:hypothetical protein